MDFGNALLLTAVIFALTMFVLILLPGDAASNSKVKVAVALVVGQITVFLVGASVWANEQVIGGRQLDELGVWSKVLVGLMLAAGASVIREILNTVKNIGENQPPNNAPAVSNVVVNNPPDGQ